MRIFRNIMMVQKKKQRIFTPLLGVFFALVFFLFLYGVIRYLILTKDGQSAEAVYRVLWETVPALLALLVAGVGIAICLNRVVSRPLEKLVQAAKELTVEPKEDEKPQIFCARGNLAELGEEFERQTEEIAALIVRAKTQAVRETEILLKQSLAREIFKDAVPPKFSLNGEGFELNAQVLSAPSSCADFADGFLIDSQTAFIAIGDVWNKGLEAARMVLKIKNELRAGVLSGKQLGEIILDLNRKLYAENKGGVAVTLFAGFFRSDNGELRFINMGHLSPVVMGFQTGFLQMNAGSALGIGEQITVAEERFYLSPGQGLVFSSRGVTDAKNSNGAAFGFDRLLSTARLCTGSPYAAEGILKAVKDFSGEALGDDLAVMVLQYVGVPTRSASSAAAAADLRGDSENIYRALLYHARNSR